MKQMPKLPRLPGFDFDNNIGRTSFHRGQQFDKINNGVCYLKEKAKSQNRYPSIHAWGEKPSTPAWLAYDGQRLKFKAYLQESVHATREAYRIRRVDISFFLEDGTMKISEPAIENSGLEQGVLVKRQRIPLPDPVKYRYFDILDLNIGKEPMIYGRVYKIIDCDQFTRKFLNRMGIPVPDPIDAPPDNNTIERQKSAAPERVRQKKVDKLGNFLKYNGKVLRFFGYWDDSESDYGYIHDLDVLLYLADGTMEVWEDKSLSNSRPAPKTIIVKRIKVPKVFTHLEPVGSSDPVTLLNVLGETANKSYYVRDSSFRGPSTTTYYEECDLTIGAQINVFGRKIVLTDMDNFTKEYYRKKYGLDDFTPLENLAKRSKEIKIQEKEIPPYNGFGSYEDSLANCFSMVPKRPKIYTDQFFRYENQDNDCRILRFGARMISDIPENRDRCFVLNVFLFDRTVAITEVTCKKARTVRLFQKRLRIRYPEQDIFTNEEPKYYEPEDFYIGATVNLNSFIFDIKTADEYTFKYMEINCSEFPKSNLKAIMSKIREAIRPSYRQFISEYSPFKSSDHEPILRYFCLREALHKYLDDRITEHEIITIARHYSLNEQRQLLTRDYVRALVHTELTRFVWNDLDRLEEEIHAWDRDKTGYLTHADLYTILRACRIPLQKELIHLMLERLDKNEKGKISWQDLLKFVNIKMDPLAPIVPINISELFWMAEEKSKDYQEINWTEFLKELDLENELKEIEPKSDKS